MNDEILMTIDDLSQKTQLPVSWFYSRTRQTGPGSIPRLKLGKYLRFRWAEVEKWLAQYGGGHNE